MRYRLNSPLVKAFEQKLRVNAQRKLFNKTLNFHRICTKHNIWLAMNHNIELSCVYKRMLTNKHWLIVYV